VIWEDEEWVGVIGLPRYSVSSFGRVFDHKRDKLLVQTSDWSGYLRVKLWVQDIRMTVSVHRLVAFAFLGSNTINLEVNHIDGDKTYNHISNLELVTRSEQMRHAYENELIDVPKRTPIICVETNVEYKSIREASRDLNIRSHKSITRVLDDPNKLTHGFHFKTKGVMP
jgi:HNH endonuclease/NUMOD4 motif